jgi:hypothetical protein
MQRQQRKRKMNSLMSVVCVFLILQTAKRNPGKVFIFFFPQREAVMAVLKKVV